MQSIEIWTDGSGSAKDRVGGWGTVIVIDGIEVELSGSAIDTTSNRMEIMAVLRGLAAVATPSYVTVYTDSQYVQTGIRKNGWVDRGPEVKNYDLWVKMNKVVNHHLDVDVKWVRGHTGVPLNERADTMAGKQRRRRLKREGIVG